MKSLYLCICIVLFSILVACGPSQGELDATATQIAANIFATQTAAAPTSTQTPTSTDTPTPANTPTPLPDLSFAALTLQDLPPGFFEVSPDEFGFEPGAEGLLGKETPIEIGFVFQIADEDFETIGGFAVLLPDTFNRIEIDLLMDLFLTGFFLGFGDSVGLENPPESQILTDLGDVGDTSTAWTAVFRSEALFIPVRVDTIVFQRGVLGIFIFVFYPDGDIPVFSIGDAARILDERIIEMIP